MRKVTLSQLRRGNRDLIKAMNRNLILNIVRKHGPISRTHITNRSGLSVGAVSQLTNELLEENWLITAGESESTGGRPQVMLRLNPHAGTVVGLKLMENRVVCAVTDLEATILYYSERAVTYDHSVDAVATTLAEVVKHTMFEADVNRKNVLGVGIGMAGVIDYQQGVVHYSPYFHWQDVSLAGRVTEQLSIPVYLENDVNTLTIEEQLFGAGRDIANFAVLTVGRGIGLGMVINHQLYQGTPGGVGEIGHVTMQLHGPACDCGKWGCLEAIASDPAVVRSITNALKEGAVSSLKLPVTFAQIVAAADHGDALAQQVLHQSGVYLGLGLSMVVNLVHPSLIVVSGEGVQAGNHRLEPMIESLREHAFNGLMDNVNILVKPMTDETWARGAASLVVGKLFESPLLTETLIEA